MNSLTRFSLLIVSAASLALVPSASSARRGADEPVDHCRQCDDAGQDRVREAEPSDTGQVRGADDATEVGEVRGADDATEVGEVRGADDATEVNEVRGADDANRQTLGRHADDANDVNDDRLPD